jgi:ribosomal protein S18 acetylase RimI-like enzyme
MRVSSSTADLRRMTETDTEPAAEMLRRGDWGERRIFFDWAIRQPTLIPMVAEADGEVVGTGVGSVHGSVGWVGTIFVEPEHRRSGLGRALTRAVCGALEERGCQSLVLIASDMGQPLYAGEGFRILEHQIRFSIDGLPPDSSDRDPLVRAYREEDFDAIVELDRHATGEDRRPILTSLLNPAATLVALRPDGSVAGYLARAPWRGGALIAPDPDPALRLLEARRNSVGQSGKAGAGLLESNEIGRARLRAAGWLEEPGGVRMIRGEPLEWHPEAIWGQFNGALG